MSRDTIKVKIARFRSELVTFGWKIIHDWSFSLSALIAYNLLISLIPMILCLFSATILIFGNDSYILNIIRDRLTESFPQQSFNDVVNVLSEVVGNQAIGAFVLTLIIAVFSGSRLFISIDDVLTIIYRMRERRVLDQNIHAIKMLLVFVTIMPIIIISTSSLALLQENETIYYFLITFLSGLFGFVLFSLIYYFVPPRDMQWSKIWCGSLCAAIGLQLLFFIFPIYVHLFMTNYVGQIGFIIITLLLFYIFALILVIGAQINAFFFDQIQPLSKSIGNAIHGYGDQENIRLIDGTSNLSTLVEGLNSLH